MTPREKAHAYADSQCPSHVQLSVFKWTSEWTVSQTDFLAGYTEGKKTGYMIGKGEDFAAAYTEGKKDGYRDALEGEEVKRLVEALNNIVDDPGFKIEGNEAAIALRMNLIAHKALAEFEKARGKP